MTLLFPVLDFELVPEFKERYDAIDEELKQAINDEVKIKSISTIPAFHCPSSACVAIVTKDNYKIVFSGDTRPIDMLAELGKKGQKTNLLIHEATMEHSMLEDCKIKKHSTFTEAVEISKKMKAEQTIFTHFSQRYAKLPILEEFQVEDAKNCGIAFDHMVISPKTIPAIPKMYPALREMFEEEYDEMLIKETYKNKRIDKVVESSLNISAPNPPVKRSKEIRREMIENQKKQRKAQWEAEKPN